MTIIRTTRGHAVEGQHRRLLYPYVGHASGFPEALAETSHLRRWGFSWRSRETLEDELSRAAYRPLVHDTTRRAEQCIRYHREVYRSINEYLSLSRTQVTVFISILEFFGELARYRLLIMSMRVNCTAKKCQLLLPISSPTSPQIIRPA